MRKSALDLEAARPPGALRKGVNRAPQVVNRVNPLYCNTREDEPKQSTAGRRRVVVIRAFPRAEGLP